MRDGPPLKKVSLCVREVGATVVHKKKRGTFRITCICVSSEVWPHNVLRGGKVLANNEAVFGASLDYCGRIRLFDRPLQAISGAAKALLIIA